MPDFSRIERNSEEIEELEVCLNALYKVNPLYLDIIQRRVFMGQSFREIGKDLGRATQLAHSKYHEAIRHLRRIYTIRNREGIRNV